MATAIKVSKEPLHELEKLKEFKRKEIDRFD